MIKRANLSKAALSKNRFRFRVRFERPPGGGVWDLERSLLSWLDRRLGKDNYAFQEDRWDGYGLHAYALHLDDHTAIPDLLAHYDGIRTEIRRRPQFRASIDRQTARAARLAIAALQTRIVERLNADCVRVIWSMGRAEMLPGEASTVGDHLMLSRIRSLSEIDALLSALPSDGEPLEVVLEDDHRGVLEVGLTMLGDVRPPVSVEEIAPIRALVDSLHEIKAPAK